MSGLIGYRGLLMGKGGGTLAAEILADLPWAYWKLDEAAGASVAAGEVNSRNLGATASPTFGVAGLVADGTALRLNGTSQYLASGNNEFGAAIATAFNGDKPFSLEAVIKASVVAGTSRQLLHLGNYSVGGTQGLWLAVLTDGKLSVGQYTAGFLAVSSSAGAIVAGTAYHVMATRAVGGAALVYINGNEVASGAMAGSIAAATATASGGMRAAVGCAYGAAGGGVPASFFAGDMDHCAIYDKVISHARVLAHAQAAGFA